MSAADPFERRLGEERDAPENVLLINPVTLAEVPPASAQTPPPQPSKG